MEKIASFTIDHTKLEPGVYVSRRDRIGKETVTTFDLRLTRPNREPVLDNDAIHTIEHLAATFLRNDAEWKDRVIYFGPMGCRTGCYMLLAGELSSEEILPLVTRTFEFIRDYQGEIPGADERSCGNYSNQNLPMARWWAERYLREALYTGRQELLHYPE